MATAQELIRTACEAIGQGNSDTDWKVAPTEHADLFAAKAPSLAQNLRRARALGLAKMYEDLNGKAVKRRDVFKSTVGRANAAVFGSASLAALLLVAGSLQAALGQAGPWVVGGVGLLGVISSGLAAMWLNQVRGGNLAKKWADGRAQAEAKRLAYFKAIMEGATDEPLDQLLAFEYTRRFLLDNQSAYFRDRGAQHDAAAERALTRSTQAVFAASTFTAAAGLLSMVIPQLAIVAGLGVIASAYATLTVSRSAVDQDRTNADNYRRALEQLQERELEIDTYREKLASGQKTATQEFFEPIFVALQADHRGFLNETEEREVAIGDMEERLDAAKEALGKKPAIEAERR